LNAYVLYVILWQIKHIVIQAEQRIGLDGSFALSSMVSEVRLTNMRVLFKNLLLSLTPLEEAPRSEAESLLLEIEEAREKMEYAWNRLNYADPAYVESAVLELYLVETQYGVLNKRYRLMLGFADNDLPPLITYRSSLSSSSTLSKSLPQ